MGPTHQLPIPNEPARPGNHTFPKEHHKPSPQPSHAANPNLRIEMLFHNIYLWVNLLGAVIRCRMPHPTSHATTPVGCTTLLLLLLTFPLLCPTNGLPTLLLSRHLLLRRQSTSTNAGPFPKPWLITVLVRPKVLVSKLNVDVLHE